MAYGNRTHFYHLPVMAEGDYLTEEQEGIQMSMIDGLLHASLLGCGKLLMEEGSYSMEWNDTVGVMKISQDAYGYSLMGIINHRLFYSREELVFTGFNPNGIYHVYVRYADALNENQSYFAKSVYLENGGVPLPSPSDSSMEICSVNTFDLSISNPGVISFNVGRPMVASILAHTAVTVNPHGQALTQENLNVTGSLQVGGQNVKGALYADFTTGGSSGTGIAVAGQPSFVSMSAKEAGAGDFWWSYSNGNVVVYNSGNAGLAAVARMEF